MVKGKIADQMKQVDGRSVLIFNSHSGEVLGNRKGFDSLQQFLDRHAKSDDPIAVCQEPKPLPPPPNCVLCKAGNVVCSKANFSPGGATN